MKSACIAAATAIALAGLMAAPAQARPQTFADTFAGRSASTCPRYQKTPRHPCNIVAFRPGGNPAADTTGSIGHANSWQSGGGPGCKTICRFTGTQY